MKKFIQTLVVAGVMAAAGGAAFAQVGEGMAGHEGMQRHDPAKMAQMHARHLSNLKARLKLTASQEAAWTAFTEAMKPPADMLAKRPDRAEMDKLSTPERLDKMRTLHKEHMAVIDAGMDKRAEATKTFYFALTAEQKKTFDAEHAKMGMHDGSEHRMQHGNPDAKPAQPPKQ